MSATTMTLQQGDMPRVEAEEQGVAATAGNPESGLLERYRADPIGVREEIERLARRDRAESMRALGLEIAKFLAGLWSIIKSN